MKSLFRWMTVPTVGVALLATASMLSLGCDTDEEVLDIEGPDGGVEVERDVTDGSLEVEVDE